MLAEHLTPMPSLAELLRGIADAPDMPVRGIASDSRRLREGYLFLAVQGLTSHGLDYLEQARQAGACAVAWDASSGDEPADIDIPLIAIRDLGQRVGEIADPTLPNELMIRLDGMFSRFSQMASTDTSHHRG